MRFHWLSAFLCCLPVAGFAQETLTLDEALALAKKNNGDVVSALIENRIAGTQVSRARAAFLPTVTPSYQWNSQRSEIDSGFGTQGFNGDGSSSQVRASWRILDSGERDLTLRGSRKAQEAQIAGSRETLRRTLFTVHQQYYDALRAQELQKVADAQTERANTILEQTKARVELRDAAAKDILQAQADALNARVQALQARNRTATANADLKATIGLPTEDQMPMLQAIGEPATDTLDPLPMLIDDALRNRPDLMTRRLGIQSLDYTYRRQKREASWSFGLDGNLDHQFTPDRLNNRTLTFLASYPLFDGGFLRETARETALRIEADKADLAQAERSARAEIESAYIEHIQNRERLGASKAAVVAARENYNAAVGAQRLGAGDLVEVLTAQVSLVTAESNAIEALYDLLSSEVRLNLVTGRPVRGE
jgi:outer membrane protein